MKAVIYARVSSTDESQSYDRQIDDLKRWASYLKLEIDKEFAEKISGFKTRLDERVEFNNMLDYVNKNNIKHIMVSELSRISRRNVDVVNVINDCSQKGITIHIQKENISTLDEKGNEIPIVQMLTGMLSSMAQQESVTLSHRIKSGKMYSARNGGNFNQSIYGYYKGEDGKPKINEDEAILIKKIFELYVEGNGTRTIANYLNINYDTKLWTHSSVYAIARNSFYCGKRRYKELIVESPAIVTEELFNKVQDFIDGRKHFAGRTRVHINPFRSFIKCQCGATMNQMISQSRKVNIYSCAKNCGIESVNRDFLIREVKIVVEKNAKLTKDKTKRSEMRQKIEANNSDIIAHEREIRTIKISSDKNYERFLASKIDENKYDEFEQKFDLRISNLEQAIIDLKNTNEALQSSLDGELLHYSDDLEIFKMQLLKAIDEIVIKKEIAQVKIKGWGKQIILIRRGTELFHYNRYLKKHNTTEGFSMLDLNALPKSEFSEEIENEDEENCATSVEFDIMYKSVSDELS